MFNITPTTWLLLLFVLIPGFVANRVYALRCPGQKQDWEKALLEPMTWSAVNLTIWIWWVFPLLNAKFEDLNRWELMAAMTLVSVLSPAALALIWYYFRTRQYAHHTWGLDYPTQKAWDYFIQQSEGFYILFHLKSKQKIGGLFGSESYATTYPHEPEIYVEKIFCVHQETGEFLSEIDGTCGSVIRQSEWDFIEFFKIPEGNADVDQETSGGDSGAATTGSTGAEDTDTTKAELAAGGIWYSSSDETTTTTKEVGGETTCRTTKSLLVWSEPKPKE